MSNPESRAALQLDALWDEVVRDSIHDAQSSEARLARRLHEIVAQDRFGPDVEFIADLRRRLHISERDMESMITGIHHIVLFCTDTDRSREWYLRAGFEYNRGYGGMHWVNAGPYELMLHPAADGPAGDAPHIHVATSDVDGLFDRAVDRGLIPMDHQQPDVPLDGPVTRPWGDREFELEDPDGNRIVITQS